MVQVKDVAFYDEAGGWSALEKASGDSYQITKDSDNGTIGKLHVDLYKTKKIGNDEDLINTSFDKYVSDQAGENKKPRKLSNSELQGTDAFEVKAYQFEANESGNRVWGEVWVYHHIDDGKTYVFYSCFKE